MSKSNEPFRGDFLLSLIAAILVCGLLILLPSEEKDWAYSTHRYIFWMRTIWISNASIAGGAIWWAICLRKNKLPIVAFAFFLLFLFWAWALLILIFPLVFGFTK